jgi:predicted nucleic acid-binding protein
VRYLLDINALIAWEHPDSSHHAAFHAWAKRSGHGDLWTCAQTELGFLRVSMQVFGYSLLQAAEALALVKEYAGGFVAMAPPPPTAGLGCDSGEDFRRLSRAVSA